jgi:membrane-associated protease RseP (regulator of RpoE activity)
MILSILAVILGIAVIVGIHEACHMFVSKLFGVKVLKFSLGFGPVLFSKKFEDTQYQLALLPLGGYIQCDGDDPESNVPNGFFSLPWYKRALIALAGPIANLLLGFGIIFTLLIMFKGWPILAALKQAYTLSAFIITTTLKWVFGMLPATKEATQGTTGLAGPIMVTKILISSLKEGVAQFLFVLSLISLSLGLFNLFPIPGLDGAHIFIYTLEGMYGKKFPAKVYYIWNLIGIILLGALMLFLCGMDLFNLFK